MKAHTAAVGTSADIVVPSYVLYSPQGSKPLATLGIVGGSATCSYDKSTRSQLLRISPSTHVSFLPMTALRSKGGLHGSTTRGGEHGSVLASQRMIVLQLFCEEPTRFGFTLTVELLLQDRIGRRRIIFSNSFQKLQRCAQHVKVPLRCVRPRVWSNIVFDVPQIHATLYAESGGRVSSSELSDSRKLLQFTLTCSSVCRVRRLLGMPQTPLVEHEDGIQGSPLGGLPPSLRLPPEVLVNWWVIRTCEEAFLNEPPPQQTDSALEEGNCDATRCPFEMYGQPQSLSPSSGSLATPLTLCPRHAQSSAAISAPRSCLSSAPFPTWEPVSRGSRQRSNAGLHVDGRRPNDVGPRVHRCDSDNIPFVKRNFDSRKRAMDQPPHSPFVSLLRRTVAEETLAEQHVTGSPPTSLVKQEEGQNYPLGALGVDRSATLAAEMGKSTDGPLAFSEGQNSLDLMQERVRRIQELIRESTMYPDGGYVPSSMITLCKAACVTDKEGNEQEEEQRELASQPSFPVVQTASSKVGSTANVQAHLLFSPRLQSNSVTHGRGVNPEVVAVSNIAGADTEEKCCTNSTHLCCGEPDEDERFTVNIIRMSSSRDLLAVTIPGENTPEGGVQPSTALRGSGHNVDRLCFDSFDAGCSLALPSEGEEGLTMEWTDLGPTPQAERDAPVVSSSRLATPAARGLKENGCKRAVKVGRLGHDTGVPLNGLVQATVAAAEVAERPLTGTPTRAMEQSCDFFRGPQHSLAVLGTAETGATTACSRQCGYSIEEESSVSVVDYRRTPINSGTGSSRGRQFMVLDSARGGFDDYEDSTHRNSCSSVIPKVKEGFGWRCTSLPPLSPTPSAHSRCQHPAPASTPSGNSQLRGAVCGVNPVAVAANRLPMEEKKYGAENCPLSSVSCYSSAICSSPRTHGIGKRKHQHGLPVEKVEEFLVFDPILKCYLDIRSNTYMTGPSQAQT